MLTEDLVKSNNELQQFAYVTSHDLRAPVVNLKSLVEFYDRSKISDANREIFDKIDTSVNRLNNTLNDLIDIVALNKQAIAASVRINFDKKVKEIASTIEEQIKDSKASFETDFRKVVSIRYNVSHVNSIFQNLITNAIKYRHPKRAPKIKITAKAAGEFIKISFFLSHK